MCPGFCEVLIPRASYLMIRNGELFIHWFQGQPWANQKEKIKKKIKKIKNKKNKKKKKKKKKKKRN